VILSAGTARLLLVPILLAYVYIAVGYARSTPRWNNPDEPAHVNVVRHLAGTGTLPVLSDGDWDSELLARLTTAWFPNDYEVDGLRYEGHQPPLYYLLAAPVHRLTADLPINRQILALRLFSIAVGTVAVAAAFVVGREAAPDRPMLAVLTAATFAFVPMNTAISSAVNNDCLATALAAVTLAALMVGRRHGFSDRWAVGLGVLIGALILTKLTVYVFVPLILGTLFTAGARARPDSPSRWAGVAGVRAEALRWPLIAAGVGLLVAGWWLIRNVLVYGPLDPLALVRHDQIVVGQPRWPSYDLTALDYFGRILFRSFWGMFGWMGVVLDDGFYILYFVLTVLGVVGVAIGWLKSRRVRTAGAGPTPRPRPRCDGEGGPDRAVSPLHRGGEGPGVGPALRHKDLLVWAAVLVFGEVAIYNLTFIQPQGRYLFPALVPIAIFLSSGWLQLADGALGGPVGRTLTAGVLAAALAWGLGEAYGALWAAELWSDTALIAAAALGVLVVLVAPRPLRARLPDGLCLVLALTLALLDLAALVKFVAPAFPLR
jgi:4-amino-4-deoxy-L-arabinose transferase-like glycosyltransferase